MGPTTPNPSARTYKYTNYRMTPDEFERFVNENDPVGGMPAEVRHVLNRVSDRKGHRFNLGYGGATEDYDGFIWVRTAIDVDWM